MILERVAKEARFRRTLVGLKRRQDDLLVGVAEAVSDEPSWG